MLKYENVSLLLVILYIVYDLLFNVLYNIIIKYATFTIYGIITTIIETIILYELIKRFIYIIKKEEVSYSDKKN